MVLFQLSKIIILGFLIALMYAVVRIFFAVRLKKVQAVLDVIMVLVIFCFLLAFTVKF